MMNGRLACSAALLGIVIAVSGIARGYDGVAVHVPLLSEAGEGGRASHSLLLGGAGDAPVVLHLNVDDVRHILLRPDDLRDAAISVKVGAAAVPGTLRLFRLSRDVAPAVAPVAADVDPTPVATAAYPAGGGTVVLHGDLTAVLNDDLKDPTRDHGLLLRADGAAAGVDLLPVAAPIPAEGSHVAALTVTLRRYANADLFPTTKKPTAGVYTTVSDGHLMYGGQRLRLWGVCRHFWGGVPVLDRMRHMGFNAIRLWGPRNGYDPASAEAGVMTDTPGTLDDSDSLATFDKFFADAKQRGFFFVMAGLHYDPLGVMQKGKTDGLDGLAADGSFLAKQFGTGPDWEAWKNALRPFTAAKKGRTWHAVSELMFFDPRLREVYRRHVINLLDHVNPYTGQRYADDEAIASWELNNEEDFGTLTTLGGNADWPQYFRDELQAQWCQWLAAHYGNDDAVRRAWGGLRAGESLDGGRVALAPFVRERADYPAARAADVVHFFCDVTDSFNQQMRATVRAQARPGVGSAVVPVVFDTGSEPSGPQMYNESLGDATSFGTYQFAFHSSLTVPPALYIMDNQSTWRKPVLIYETQSIRPGPFRAEYPLRVAALAGWQDWDGVFFHYWKGDGDQPDEGYQGAPMDLPRKGYMDGGIYPDADPAYCASLAIAGRAFRSGAVAPAPDPVVYQVPLTTVYGYATEKGIDMRRDTFSRGAYAAFTGAVGTPTAPPVSVAAEVPVTGAVRSGTQVLYDWPNGRMVIDTPTMKAYVGQPHGAYRFSDGLVLEQVSTPFVAFAMVSADGKPLVGEGASRRIYLTAHFDARNTGFRLGDRTARDGESSGWDGNWSDAMAANILAAGAAPVVTDPVSYQVDFPTRLDARDADYDFAFRQTAEQAINGNVIRQAGGAPFMKVLEVASRGPAVPTPQSDAPKATDPVAPGARNPLDLPDPVTGPLYMPVPRVDWGEGYDAVAEYLRDSTMLCSSIGKEFPDAAHAVVLNVSELEPLKDIPAVPPADVELSFAAGRLVRISALFAKSQPSVDVVVRAYSAVLGQPVRSTADAAQWTQRIGTATLSVAMLRQGGRLTLTYEAHD
jgi:hypothetical protein